MEDPVYVTEVAERERTSLSGIRVYLDVLFMDDEAEKWWSQFGEKNSFTFKPKHFYGKHNACNLYYRLMNAIKERDIDAVRKFLPEMKKHCQKNHEDLSDLERWKHASVQLPGDWGPVGPRNKRELKRIISNLAYGKVLEAMCGFRSYFNSSDSVTEVVALDFCREGLERYDYPNRKRILYDLERIVNGEKMEFFEDSFFQTIGVSFGIDYLTDPVPILKEFYRILSEDGQLLIVGGTRQGYGDIIKRWFKPTVCAENMQKAGFNTRVEHLKHLKTEYEFGHYYLVNGKKQ